MDRYRCKRDATWARGWIARLNTYDKVQRYLVGLTWEGPPPDDFGANAILYDGEQEVGQVTSAMPDTAGGVMALGYMKAAVAADARSLTVRVSGEPIAVTQQERPFWEGKTRRATPLG